MAEQKAKPKIEDTISKYLDGEMKASALEFVAYLYDSKMKPTWSASDVWRSTYKNVSICRTFVYEGKSNHQWIKEADTFPSWCVGLYLKHIDKYGEVLINEGIQDFIWDNVCYCNLCRVRGRTPCHDRPPGRNITLLSKKVKSICNIVPVYGIIWVYNPGEKEKTYIKRLIELEQKAIIENKTVK